MKRKHKKKTAHKPIADRVKTLAARGLVEDEIAQRLGIDKNTLRAKYIDAIKRGRQARLKDDDLTIDEMQAGDMILRAINSDWHTPNGNDLWPGLTSDNALSAVDAFARWKLDGGFAHRVGLSNPRLDRERIAEIRKLKAQAEALLANWS